MKTDIPIIAVCTKVWICVNLSIFASSDVETCAASITMTSHPILITLLALESPHLYLSHNVGYMCRNLIYKFIYEMPSFETVQTLGPYFG